MLSDREKALFDGYSIISADIIRKDRVILGLKEDYDIYASEENYKEKFGNLDGFVSKGEDELAKRVIQYNSGAFIDQDNWGGRHWSGGVRRVYPVFLSKLEKVIVCLVQGDSSGKIAELPDDKEGWLNTSSKDYELPFHHNTMFAVSNISGNIFFAGAPRKLFMRLGVSKWVDLTDESIHSNLQDDLKKAVEKHGDIMKAPYGFHAFDGFDSNNIYTGGRHGDCWHYDGSRWQRLDLPSNFHIHAIVCAPDEYIYIAGRHGGFIRGKIKDGKELWEVIINDVHETFNEMAWFLDTLYLATDEGLYSYSKDKFARYNFPRGGATQYSFSGVKSCDEALVSYGSSQALVFDGKEWVHIIGTPSVVIPSADDILDI